MDHLVTITQRPTGESKSPFNDARFVRKNTEIKSDTSDQATDSQSDSNETRKSTYVIFLFRAPEFYLQPEVFSV